MSQLDCQKIFKITISYIAPVFHFNDTLLQFSYGTDWKLSEGISLLKSNLFQGRKRWRRVSWNSQKDLPEHPRWKVRFFSFHLLLKIARVARSFFKVLVGLFTEESSFHPISVSIWMQPIREFSRNSNFLDRPSPLDQPMERRRIVIARGTLRYSIDHTQILSLGIDITTYNLFLHLPNVVLNGLHHLPYPTFTPSNDRSPPPMPVFPPLDRSYFQSSFVITYH